MSKRRISGRLKVFLRWYGFTMLGLILTLFVFLALSDQVQRDRFWYIFWISLRSISSSIFFYLIALAPYLIYQLIRSFIRDYRKQKWTGLAKGITLRTLTPFILIWGGFQLIDGYRFGEQFDYQWDHSVENKTDTIRDLYVIDQKQRGIHVMDLMSDTTDLEILKTNNIEWLTFVPFISQDHYNTPSLGTTLEPRSTQRRLRRWKRLKRLSTEYGFKIMVKPHIWLKNRPGNVWRSSIQMTSEKDWQDWFQQYGDYILSYARIAETIGVEQFCIGTELNVSVMEKPDEWLKLITKVRSVFSGKITYAANWDDDLANIKLWDALDLIGIQAYFPIADRSAPELAELQAGWKSHVQKLESLNRQFGKPILFTEIGYKTTRDAGKEPWEWDTFNNRFYKRISHKTQALCYQAFFNTVWQQPWFAGAHIWEWQSRGTSDGNNNSFTLEGKPALNVMAKGFGKSKAD